MSSVEVIRRQRRFAALWTLGWLIVVAIAGLLCAVDGSRDWLTRESAVIAGVVIGCLIAPAGAVIWLHHRMELRQGLKCRGCLEPLTLENQRVTIRVTRCCGNCGKTVITHGQRFLLEVDGEPVEMAPDRIVS